MRCRRVLGLAVSRAAMPALGALALALTGCWPPIKFSAAGGGTAGGARAPAPSGREQIVDRGGVFHGRAVMTASGFFDEPLDHELDGGIGWSGEWIDGNGTSSLLRQGLVVEASWFAVRGTPAPGWRWRIGPTLDVFLYGQGVGGTVGITMQYAMDRSELTQRPDPGRKSLGAVRGEFAAGIFLRAGLREHDEGDTDQVALAGIELSFPSFCGICPD